MFKLIDVNKIDPSPFQIRKHRDEGKLKELAASIQRSGLIEPIVVRRIGRNGNYQNIAGGRRLEAIRKYTDIKSIQAQIVDVDDLQAREISAAENLQREDLSVIETIEGMVELVDAQLIKDKQYALMGNSPANRVKALLGKLKATRRSKERGYNPSKALIHTTNTYVRRVEKIFKNLPKPIEWLSFLHHDLPILMDICEDVKKASIQDGLNISQTKALEQLKAASNKEFQRVITKSQHSSKAGVRSGGKYSPHIDLKDLSSREINNIAEKAAKKEGLIEFNRSRVSPSLKSETVIVTMNSLGIPEERIAPLLKINRKTVKKHAENPRLLRSIKKSLGKGLAIHEVAKKHGCPEPLVWSVALEGKSDQERFKALNWGLRTWDQWYFNDVDKRFGDDWPGQIPAQLVGHTLFYFTQEGDLVFDPMAGGGVVPDTCLAFHRKCWSFDLADRHETRPEIEPHLWDPESLVWPVKGKEKPDLIFFDPPYFNKMAEQYEKESISALSRKEYLKFFRELFPLFKEHSKKDACIAFLNSDWPPARRAYASEGETFRARQRERKTQRKVFSILNTLNF